MAPPVKLELTTTTTTPSNQRELISSASTGSSNQHRDNKCTGRPSHDSTPVHSTGAVTTAHTQNSSSELNTCIKTTLTPSDQTRDVHVKTERLSITPNTIAITCDNKSTILNHPLVTSKKSISHRSLNCEPQTTKLDQNGPKPQPPTHKSTTPSNVPTSQIMAKNLPKNTESPHQPLNTSEKEKDVNVKESEPVDDVAEEARRQRRQEQQRLQKEKWQKRYGIGVKRLSEGDLSSGGESETGLDVAFDANTNDDYNDLISAG